MTGKTIGALCLVMLLSACGGDSPVPATMPLAALQATIERERASAGLPGLALVAVDMEHIDTVSTGVRTAGGTAPLLPTDALQGGSQTKAATAMLVARLVEQHKLRWDSTLAEVFPAWRESMQPALRGVTVELLLRHRGGLQRDLEEADGILLAPLATGEPVTDRATAAQYILRQPPVNLPGSTYLYSNVGYLLAGLIAETAGGASYEALMQQEVFAPLGITASFGFPEDGGGTLAGHVWREGRWQVADYPAADRYNMARISAAADGMTIGMADYGKLLREQLRGLRGTSTFLSRESFARMHGPVGEYGLGWSVVDYPGRGPVSAHEGSWGSYYMFAVVVPGTHRAVAVACNCYGDVAVERLDELTRRLALAP